MGYYSESLDCIWLEWARVAVIHVEVNTLLLKHPQSIILVSPA